MPNQLMSTVSSTVVVAVCDLSSAFDHTFYRSRHGYNDIPQSSCVIIYIFFSSYIERHMNMKQKQKLSIQLNKHKFKTKIMINRVG